MTVEELISVLSEMDRTLIVAVAVEVRHGDSEWVVANEEVYECMIEVNGETVAAVALSIPGDDR